MFFKLRVTGALSLALLFAGCGGGGGGVDAPTAQALAAAATAGTATSGTDVLLTGSGAQTVATTTSACGTSLPALPSAPAGARRVTDFGAVPNDNVDDTAAIQRALDSLREGEWLVFPPGKYLHNKSLLVNVKGAKLWGDGAVLHGTNPSDQALWIRADNVEVYRFTKTAVTESRRSTPWESGIAIYGQQNGAVPVYGTVIRGNRITYAGAPGTNLQASASSAGILVYRARNFLVAENTVERSLSDGIHMTGGSRNGRVLNNIVRENGDDMIAVVSYIGANWTASALADRYWLDRTREAGEVRDVLIANNDVSGQYWGRGVSVVGGSNVTIQNNRISRTTGAAAIYLAREQVYHTFGDYNILVKDNTIDDNQVSPPVFVPTGASFTGLQTTLASGVKSGQGAIEIYSTADSAELQAAAGTQHLSVQSIRLENNTINRVAFAGIRIGNYSPPNSIYRIAVINNRMTNVPYNPAMQVFTSGISQPLYCSGNTDDGAPITGQLCTAPSAPTVPGANVTCQ